MITLKFSFVSHEQLLQWKLMFQHCHRRNDNFAIGQLKAFLNENNSTQQIHSTVANLKS